MKDLVDSRLDMMLSAKKREEMPSTPVHHAIVSGDLEQVKIMIKEGINPLDTDINDNTLLHFAAEVGSLDVLKYLIEDVSCNPSEKGWDGTTVLHAAAVKGKLAVVNYLLEDHNMEVTVEDDNGNYPLTHACASGKLEVVQYIIQRMQEYKELVLPDNSPNWTYYALENPESSKCLGEALCQACYSGHLSVMKYLIEDINLMPTVSIKNGQQAIHYAAENGGLEIIRYLIEEQCCKASVPDDDGQCPLYIASQRGHLQVVRYLTLRDQHNCDPGLTCYDNENCLHVAARKGYMDIVQFFVKELKCDIYAKGPLKFYPIHFAAQSGNLELFRYFVEELNCDPLSTIDRGDDDLSTLHVAAAAGNLSIVQYLIETKECDPMVGFDNYLYYMLLLHMES